MIANFNNKKCIYHREQLLISFFIILSMVFQSACGEAIFAFGEAMDSAFVLASQAAPVSNNMACKKSILDLMIRQNIPHESPDAIRSLSDRELYKLAMMAAVAGISRWTRNDNNTLLALTEDGKLIHPYSPGVIESDVMLCVICALLTVIATFHLTPSAV